MQIRIVFVLGLASSSWFGCADDRTAGDRESTSIGGTAAESNDGSGGGSAGGAQAGSVSISSGGDANAGSSGTSAGAGPAGIQPVDCLKPNCCVPLRLSPTGTNLYQSGRTLQFVPIVTRQVLPTAPANWEASLEVVLPWNATVTCSSTVYDNQNIKYLSVDCPPVELLTPLECGSQVALILRPRSSTFSDAAATTATCNGTAGLEFAFTVPVECPSCPLSPNPSGGLCDYAGACTYTTLDHQTNTPMSNPCGCQLESTTGERRWACAFNYL